MSLTRQQVREVDRFAIERLGVPGVILMENAGKNAAGAIAGFLRGPTGSTADAVLHAGVVAGEADAPGVSAPGPDTLTGRRIAIVAGGGNNGGDGFVIARHLAMMGARVTVFLTAPADQFTGDAAVNLRIIENLRYDIKPVTASAGLADLLRPFELIVDAIGGTGIRGALRGPTAQLIEQVNAAGVPIVAVDIPTGLDCDTGMADGPAIRAALTVTFVDRKAGFDAPGSAAYTGKVLVADIGIPADVVRGMIGQTARSQEPGARS